jgi:hypothetical protein
MTGESQTKITLPKLSPDGANWVTYHNHFLYTLDSGRLHEHIQHAAMPSLYTTTGNIDGVTPNDCWAKEEGTIRTLISNSIPDLAFNKIKSQVAVKNIYKTLKSVYEDHSSALIADLMRCFQSKKCRENKSICTHLKQLANYREQLAVMGKSITDADHLDTLFASLPLSYEQAFFFFFKSEFISRSAYRGSTEADTCVT